MGARLERGSSGKKMREFWFMDRRSGYRPKKTTTIAKSMKNRLDVRTNIPRCFLGLTLVPRENKSITYAKFWRDKQRVLWCYWKWSIARVYHLFLPMIFFIFILAKLSLKNLYDISACSYVLRYKVSWYSQIPALSFPVPSFHGFKSIQN